MDFFIFALKILLFNAKIHKVMSIKSLNVLSYILAGFSILLIILGCFAPVVFTQCNSCMDFTGTGQIGDTIGGTMSPIVAIAGVFMTFIAFLMQINANRIQSEQLKKSFNLRLLENRIESRNALQLMSVDIYDMIKDIDLTCKNIDSFCASTEDTPTGEVPFRFTPKQSRYRYNSIDRNLVYSAFSFFMTSKEYIDDFRATYSLMDFYSEGIDSLYSNVYIPYMDEIMNIKKQIPVAFENLYGAIMGNRHNVDDGLLNMFCEKAEKCVINGGILNVLELHKILEEKIFFKIYDANNEQYRQTLELTKSLVTQNEMMISAMCDAKEKFLKKEAYERLKQLGNKIETALSKNTIESIQEEFDKQI